MNRLAVSPINLNIHGIALATLAISGLYSFTSLGTTISQWNEGKTIARTQSQAIEAIEHDAELTQAKIDNHINIFDSVVLTDYTCDPNSPPRFDAAPFAKQQQVKVADQNQRVIGVIHPSGTFEFLPGNCNGPVL
jgi:hypothetical protein